MPIDIAIHTMSKSHFSDKLDTRLLRAFYGKILHKNTHMDDTEDIGALIKSISERPMYYRPDGTPYPGTDDAATMAWAKDFEDMGLRRVGDTALWWGGRVSTVWLGLDHGHGMSHKPLIFESMVFGWKLINIPAYLAKAVFGSSVVRRWYKEFHQWKLRRMAKAGHIPHPLECTGMGIWRFFAHPEVETWRYPSLVEAQVGHRALVRQYTLPHTLVATLCRRWFT